MKNTINLNQFQSCYPLNANHFVIVDYLQGKLKVFDKEDDNYTIEQDYSEEYNTLCETLGKKLQLVRKKNISIVLIPSYKCNMFCEYCYEGEIKSHNGHLKNFNVDIILKCIKEIMDFEKVEKVEFHMLGGEPIQEENIKFFTSFFDKAKKVIPNFTINCITNGLEAYKHFDELKRIGIQHFQITIDGPARIHNSRRIALDEKVNSFDEISKSIQKLINNSIPTTIRINVDETNIDSIPELAETIHKNGWTDEIISYYLYPISVSGHIKNKRYLSEIEMFKRTLDVIKNIQNNFFRLDFHGISFIDSILDNKPIMPKLQFCGAAENQYVFDSLGKIYSCWWGVSDDRFIIGENKNQKYTLDINYINKWRSHNVLNISRCKDCKFKYICGAGCTYKAMEKNNHLDYGNCADFDTIIGEYLKYRLNPSSSR